MMASLTLSLVVKHVGKSSLANRLANKKRSIVSVTLGTARDAIDTMIEWRTPIRLVDTAGTRARYTKRTLVPDLVRGLRAMDRANVYGFLWLTHSVGVTEQDKKLANMAVDADARWYFLLNRGGTLLTLRQSAMR